MKNPMTIPNCFWIVGVVTVLGVAGATASPPPEHDAHNQAAATPASSEKPAAAHSGHGESKPAAPRPAKQPQGVGAEKPNKTAPAKPAPSPREADFAAPPLPPTIPVAAEPSTAEQAMTMLVEANERWISGKSREPHTETSRRAALAQNGQQPYATILTCSDSRLPAERIFDCGVGDIFVVRVAGNIMGESEAGTIEYGLEHLHTPLLVVMGHTKCGAVSAAATDAHVEGHIASLVKHIDPAVDRARKLHPDLHDAEIIPEAIKENVWQSIFDLIKTSDITRTLVREGKVQIVGAVCDIATGKVELLGEHPWQSELVTALSTPANSTSEESTASASEH